MGRREELLGVFRDHKNTGYVPCFFTDLNMCKPSAINERPEGADGYDGFGVHWTYVPQVGAPMVTPGTKALEDVTEWREKVKFPNVSEADWEACAKRDTEKWDRENKLSTVMLINGPFERTHALMGFEDALMALTVEPEAYGELVNALADYKCEVVRLVGKYYKPDIVCMHDDFGSNDRMLMSPATWRAVFKEPTRRIIAAAHEAGMLYEHHSCGYIEPIFDELVEIGIDSIDPLQITNNWRAIKDRHQHHVTFSGGFDNQGVFDRAGVTEEEIRAETRRVYDLLAPGGSYAAFPLTLTFGFVPTFIDEHYKIARNYGEK